MSRTRDFRHCCRLTVVATLFVASTATARPILYADSTTIAADYRSESMRELQISYAPTPFLSLGLGHLELVGSGPGHEHQIQFARLNLLAKRWNLEAAQGNIFLWGGAGRSKQEIAPGARDSGQHNHGAAQPGQTLVLNETAGNIGGQIDYETTRIYVSFATDSQFATSFTHRMDTLQLGFAPYEHTADGLATFFLISGTQFSGNLQQDTQVSVLLRLFKKRTWIEAGVTTDGKPQARFMLTF